MHSFKELVKLFEERFIASIPFPDSPQSLYEPCRYFLTIGGKRIRPVMCLMASELFGAITDDAWHAATGIELFHNFTLIHDDIMDKAPLRRGRQTLHERNGLTAGILCGDVTSIYAYDQLANIKKSLSQILHLFNKTSMEVCEGQQLDMDFEGRDDVQIEEYLRMITLKTSVLIACSLKMGGLLGGTTEGNANKLYAFGKNLGIAFQLQDDYLDAFGTVDKVGKQRGGDILSNKKTFLLLKAIENANSVQREKITSLLKRSDEQKVGEMLQIFSDTAVDSACLNLIAKYSDEGYNSLDEVAAPQARKTSLHELANYLLKRQG